MHVAEGLLRVRMAIPFACMYGGEQTRAGSLNQLQGKVDEHQHEICDF